MGVVVLIAGIVLVGVGGQGVIRLLTDHSRTGVLGGLHLGFGWTLTAYLLIVVAGLAIGGFGDRLNKAQPGTGERS